MFETYLPAGYVLFDLLDKGQEISELGQPVVRFDKRFVEVGGTGSDEGRVDCVGFGVTQPEAGIGFHLSGLQHQDGEARPAQMGGDATFVGAGRFEADAIDACLGQGLGQRLPARQVVLGLPALALLVDRDIELALGCIDSSRRYGSFCHLH